MEKINPIINMDYPDPDVIRVDDTYYMVSTTMYFMPGCEILRSYDLVHWEHAAYVYETLDGTPAQRLENGENAYGQGMWAASIRFHKGIYYICFVANDTGKTYLYRSESIEGPWRKSEIEGFYHDNSILFDDDGRIYIVYGNREIYLTELNEELTGPKEGGVHRLIIRDTDDAPLGYEGAHFYKINGRYYIFLIHIPKETGRRTESCFVADSLDGEFTGRDVMDDDRGFFNSGVAQGGIVETPKGRWYAILFQDSGAIGRMPFLMPVSWDGMWPVFGDNGKIPESFEIEDNRPGYKYAPLTGSVSWQFNHEPELSLIEKSIDENDNPVIAITTDRLCLNLVQAKNIYTMRAVYPGCTAAVTLDASEIREGDYAGLSILQSSYAFAAVTKRNGEYWLVMKNRDVDRELGIWGERHDKEPGEELGAVKLDGPVVRIYADAEFENMKDKVKFFYTTNKLEIEKNNAKLENTCPIGEEAGLRFILDHFTGARFGLFIYSTKECGGRAAFSGWNME